MIEVKDAPYIGLCKEDYKNKILGEWRVDDIVCYCEQCGCELYDNDDIYELNDESLCCECFGELTQME